jgi:3-oxoacyl-[acyl-carrier protein] reductase
MELAGKVALVTGGSRGIGAGIARRLAHDGASVAITYLSAADRADQVVKEISASGGRALALQADSADPEAVVAAVERTAAEFGGLDVYVSNAGFLTPVPLQATSVAEIDHVLAAMVRAAFVGTQAATRHMHEGGSVVYIGSCLSERVPVPELALYSMAKAALDGLAKGLARDLGPRGITVTSVHPGPIETDTNPSDSPFSDFQRATTALGRYGTVEDVAAAVALLAGPGGRYITGTTIAVDGGFAAL